MFLGKLDLYAEFFANWLSGGNLVNHAKISLLGIKTLFDRILTHGYITKVWCITKMPTYYNKNLGLLLRMEMQANVPDSRTVVHSINEPVQINLQDDSFKRQFNKAVTAYNNYKALFDELPETAQYTGYSFRNAQGSKVTVSKDTLKQLQRVHDSYIYVNQQVASTKGFYSTKFFIQASVRNKKDLKTYVKNMRDLLEAEGIKYQEVKGNVSKYLSNFCPTTYPQENVSGIANVLFSHENIIANLNYKTIGFIGDTGILLGNDVRTKFPFFMNFTRSGAAQVVLLLSKAGQGKTVEGFLLALGCAGLNIHWSVTDIKGNEWYEHLHPFMKVLKISMDDTNGNYVNFLRLDDLECTEEDCVQAYTGAIRDTVTLFTIMVNLAENEGNLADLENIIETAVSKVFSSVGVISDKPATFKRTRDLNYTQVLDVINELSKSKSYTESQINLCTLLRTRCTPFFSGGGRYGNCFRNEITVQEIFNTPGVVYAFNKNANVTLDVLDSIRVHMAQGLDNRKTLMRKRQHLFTASFYEELQRCVGFSQLIQALSHRITGSRSDNAIVVLLLNAVSTLGESGLEAIKSNITSKIVGKLEDADIEHLVKYYGCSAIEGYMKKIAHDESGKYRNSFAVFCDDGCEVNTAIVKAQLPARVLQALQTRDISNV